MELIFVVALVVIFILWCKLSTKGKALTALFLILATPFFPEAGLLLGILLILWPMFGIFFGRKNKR